MARREDLIGRSLEVQGLTDGQGGAASFLIKGRIERLAPASGPYRHKNIIVTVSDDLPQQYAGRRLVLLETGRDAGFDALIGGEEIPAYMHVLDKQGRAIRSFHGRVRSPPNESTLESATESPTPRDPTGDEAFLARLRIDYYRTEDHGRIRLSDYEHRELQEKLKRPPQPGDRIVLYDDSFQSEASLEFETDTWWAKIDWETGVDTPYIGYDEE